MIGEALSERCYRTGDRAPAARLWLRPGRALYVGPSLELDMHSGAVSCLAIGVDGAFTVAAHGHGTRVARSALIPPRLTHRVVAHTRRMAFCYLDADSAHQVACHRQMTDVTTAADEGIGFGHRHEAELVRLADELDQGSGSGTVRSWFDLAGAGRVGTGDARIERATTRLRLAGGRTLSAAQLAAETNLSLSRFLHLFRQQTGTSFRRYRLWIRMAVAAGVLAAGHDLTRAAADAGFASPSHFSTAFHAMFGLPPRHLSAMRILPFG